MNNSPLVKRKIELYQPEKLVFGNGCIQDIIDEVISLNKKRVFLLLSGSVEKAVDPVIDGFKRNNISVCTWMEIDREPSVKMFEKALETGQDFEADAIIGIGGGSVLDVAKLVAALMDGTQSVKEVIGIGKLHRRSTLLCCLPTTAGTGSEVSPNAILYDEKENLKKGIISPFLVPDISFIDPELTMTVPPSLTAATGLDALTHCIEAYTNRFAHPMIDLYALEGIRLIGKNLQKAVEDGKDREARTKIALGSLYGGLCLGPVNTAAVHALSYPLGSEYKIAHGISNAMLLPYVMEFNLEAAPKRYGYVAEALAIERRNKDLLEWARQGVEKIRQLMKACGIPEHMSAMGIPKEAIGPMAESAMSITRLLKNNPRTLSEEDAKKIYRRAY